MAILIGYVIAGSIIESFVARLERKLPATIHILIGIIVGGLLGWFFGNLIWGELWITGQG